jgi:DNA helicase HerA-like ATPase
MSIEQTLKQSMAERQKSEAICLFKKIIQKEQYVGELFSINYEEAKVQIHDHERKKVGGIPSLCFLIATRIEPDVDEIDFKTEDASFILLRVMDATQLPDSAEAERIRVETAKRVSGETNTHWDEEGIMDTKTRVYLGYAGVKCRIIGTFYLEDDASNTEVPLALKFGGDISNYYPNRGLKVYKPNADSLSLIVNYIDPFNLQEHKEKYGSTAKVKLGHVRYASTNRKYQKVDDVPVYSYPADLLTQKTALFGMTRTGKSNTTKIISKSIYQLRFPANSEGRALKIGQIIFDPNGEYANENVQDASSNNNPNALKNVWKINKLGKKDDVVTYGILPHPNDPDRNMMLLNFFHDENLQIGKEILNSSLYNDTTKFISNFRQVAFEQPEPTDASAMTRYNRRVLAYRALLAKAGFQIPTTLRADTRRLFSNELLNGRANARTGTKFNGMKNYHGDPENTARYLAAANVFSNDYPNWPSLADAFSTLFEYMKTDDYKLFENWYVNERNNASGDYWADEDLKKILEMINRPNGARQIGKVRNQHSASTTSDYAEDIYNCLKVGKLVIIDQSSGEPEVNKSSADRIMWVIFRKNQEIFRTGKTPPDILIYVEEAHNLLPAGGELDLQDVWVRTAKEGAKYKLGLIYATQEVSSIQKNILKNTANWFIGHLNNTDETKELCKYYDYADFELSIRRAQDKGFLRVKTLSNLFIIPVQVDKFVITT